MKIAVVASGWHFPLHFYKTMAKQFVPPDWTMDLFVVAHRLPEHAEPEVKQFLSTIKKRRDVRAILDRRFYKKVATVEEIQKLGWNFSLEPNTIGDWGNANQWLEKHDYKEYDIILFTHDDNLILNYQLIHNVVKGDEYDSWLILSNSTGMPPGMLRGSFEFFKREMLDRIGGKFDMSLVKLTREGVTSTNGDLAQLTDWNNTVTPLMDFIDKENLREKVGAMSPCYRVSMFCIEGERGFISNTHGINTEQEERGIATLQHHGII